jgi:hypothetical protein
VTEMPFVKTEHIVFGQIIRTEPIVPKDSYECAICHEYGIGDERVLNCARCRSVRKMHAACFERSAPGGDKGCTQCVGAMSTRVYKSMEDQSARTMPGGDASELATLDNARPRVAVHKGALQDGRTRYFPDASIHFRSRSPIERLQTWNGRA